MTGVVLCGGQSTRMGTDKGLLLNDGQTWTELALNKLTSLQIPVFISLNKEQAVIYSDLFPVEQLVVDDETLSVKGPLLGLLTAHIRFPDEDLLVLACDMIDMGRTLLADLLEHYKSALHEAYVYITNEKSQPLSAIYTAKGLKKIYSLYQQGQLRKFSMMSMLEMLDVHYIATTSVECFKR